MAPITNNVILLFLLIIYLAALPTIVGLYVYRDSRHNGMNARKWTVLSALLPCFSGFVIYLLVRRNIQILECANCGTPVSPEASICPGCLNKLKPCCNVCKYPVNEDWITCPKCSSELPVIYEEVIDPIRRKNPSLWLVILSLVLIPCIIALCISCNLFSDLDSHFFFTRYTPEFEIGSGFLSLDSLDPESWYSVQHNEYVDGKMTKQTSIHRVLWGGYTVEKESFSGDTERMNLKTETAKGEQFINGTMRPFSVIEEHLETNRTNRHVRAEYIKNESGNISLIRIKEGGAVSNDKGILRQTNYFEYDQLDHITKQTVEYESGDTRTLCYNYVNDDLLTAIEYDADNVQIKQYEFSHDSKQTTVLISSVEGNIDGKITAYYNGNGTIDMIVHENADGVVVSETVYSYEFWNALAGFLGVILVFVAVFLTAFILVHTHAESLNRRYMRAKKITIHAKLLQKGDGGTECVPTAGHHVTFETDGGILDLAIEKNQYSQIVEGIEGNLTHKGGWFESFCNKA